MKHGVSGRKLGLPNDQRMALLHGIVRSLIMYGAVETTEPRAKEARKIAEKLITTAKDNTLHARRQARKILPPPHPPKDFLRVRSVEQKKMREELKQQDPVRRLFDVVIPKVVDKTSGFTRLTKIGCRRGDAAPIVKLEIISD